MLKEERDNLNENLKILTTIKLISWNWWSSSLIFCFLSVGNHVDAVEAARFKRNRGLTKVKKASRMLADSMAEVSMYAKPFSAANWAAVDSSISLRSKRSALLPIIPQKIFKIRIQILLVISPIRSFGKSELANSLTSANHCCKLAKDFLLLTS